MCAGAHSSAMSAWAGLMGQLGGGTAPALVRRQHLVLHHLKVKVLHQLHLLRQKLQAQMWVLQKGHSGASCRQQLLQHPPACWRQLWRVWRWQ